MSTDRTPPADDTREWERIEDDGVRESVVPSQRQGWQDDQRSGGYGEDRYERYDEDGYDERGRHGRTLASDAEARDQFGGTNIGAAFFGWLVAVAMTVILTAVAGAAAAALGRSGQFTQADAEREAATVGVVAAVVIAAILLTAYYTGGYVAGRMSRFDGGRQGLAVWLLGVLVTVLTVGVGMIFGAQYNLLDRVSLPQIPIPNDQLGTGGLVTALAILVGTALAAMAGGKVGRRYHDKVDSVAYR